MVIVLTVSRLSVDGDKANGVMLKWCGSADGVVTEY